MKRLIQLRVSKRQIEKTSLEEATLLALESHFKESIQLLWSASKQYLLVMEKNSRINALSFSHQWTTLWFQFKRGKRLKCYIKVPTEFLKRRTNTTI